MRSNLHCHSRYSDGTLWPEAIAERAKGFGLECISLTDHDTLEGTDEFVSACSARGLLGIVGVEIDCMDDAVDYRSELLGYFPEGSCPATRTQLRERISQRRRLMVGYLQRARELFGRPDLDLDELLTLRSGGVALPPSLTDRLTLTKPDLFRYLQTKSIAACEVGYTRFKLEWFQPGRLAEEPERAPSLGEAIGWIRTDGGRAVLPHPGWLFDGDPGRVSREQERLRVLLEHARGLGLWGVELYWYLDDTRSAAINVVVREVGSRLGLGFTYGSDCHGPGSHIDSLGAFSGEFAGFA
jgi:hypothetical protein